MSGIWKPATRSNPCPICNGTSKCGIAENAVYCHRVQSDDVRKDRFGHTVWLHHLRMVPYDQLPLDMRWCEAMKMAVVPMKSPNGLHVVGMNGRHFVGEDHRTPSLAKQNAEGSVDGLFIPLDLLLLAYKGDAAPEPPIAIKRESQSPLRECLNHH